jgi:signal transduction histidine kinase/CheY-like chemotaxis protein
LGIVRWVRPRIRAVHTSPMQLKGLLPEQFAACARSLAAFAQRLGVAEVTVAISATRWRSRAWTWAIAALCPRPISPRPSHFPVRPLRCPVAPTPSATRVKLRTLILLFLLVFALAPLLLAVLINLPLVLDRTALFYQKAYLQNLRADFRDLDQHLASRNEMIRLLAKLPEPGLILGESGDEDATDLARARYTGWINQILGDQRDIIQILFLGPDGGERFWLTRDAQSGRWSPSASAPEPPSPKFVEAGLRLQPGAVLVSRIRVNTGASRTDPRQLMTLDLIGVIGGEAAAGPGPSPAQPANAPPAGGPAAPTAILGAVVITIDVGGLAQFYRDTLWVNTNGTYLRPGQAMGGEPQAFRDFPGLAGIFAEGKLALWKGKRGEELLWVPMFLTEDEVPLWVGRPVDPSPIANFRNALMMRVLSIILLLIFVVLLLARWSATRVERFGQELTGGIGRVLREGRPIRFRWKGPREVSELADNLTVLSETHADFLRAARAHTQELEQSNRYKSEFLANVSHELRTPLNSILLLSKMLADDHAGLDPQQRRQAQVINEAGRDLRAMIDNILDISRIEAGQIAVSLEWVELRPLLLELMGLVGPLFADKGLSLSMDVAPGAPERAYSDREKLRQILKNFLSNAVKFTDHGGVAVSLLGSGAGGCPLGIAVVDTGIGIPKDKQGIIFEAFQQADGSTRRRYGGTGLGLSISRELAKLLGGRIEVESEEGQGSRFTLWLPLEMDPSNLDANRVIHEPPPRPSASAAAPLSEPAQPADPTKAATQVTGPARCYQGHWALLVERDVQALVAMTAMLEGLGVRVRTAVDLGEALETLQEEGPCSLVLLATLVSARDTCDTIQAIGRDPRYRQVPIVVMGGAADRAQIDRCGAPAPDHFLRKPVGPAELDGLLEELLGAMPGERPRNTA